MEGAGGREQARPAGIGPAKLLFVARPAQGPSPVRGWTPKRRFGGSNRRQPVWYLDENWNGSEPETPSMKAARTVAELRQALGERRLDAVEERRGIFSKVPFVKHDEQRPTLLDPGTVPARPILVVEQDQLAARPHASLAPRVL